jgi:hypothetical protein
MMDDAGEHALDMIWEEVRMRLNPDGDECPECGGEGVIFECFDGFCLDAEIGCEDCTRDCAECKRFRSRMAREVRIEVIESDSIQIAKAWLKSINRWNDSITDDQIMAEMAKEREKLNVERNRTAGAPASGAEGSPLPSGAGSAESGEASADPQQTLDL